MTNVFAQNNSKTNYEILVCDFVQYCSNPIVMNLTLTLPDEVSQKTKVDVQKSTNLTTPEAVSNISVMITPDLYNDIAR